MYKPSYMSFPKERHSYQPFGENYPTSPLSTFPPDSEVCVCPAPQKAEPFIVTIVGQKDNQKQPSNTVVEVVYKNWEGPGQIKEYPFPLGGGTSAILRDNMPLWSWKCLSGVPKYVKEQRVKEQRKARLNQPHAQRENIVTKFLRAVFSPGIFGPNT